MEKHEEKELTPKEKLERDIKIIKLDILTIKGTLDSDWNKSKLMLSLPKKDGRETDYELTVEKSFLNNIRYSIKDNLENLLKTKEHRLERKIMELKMLKEK